MKNLVLSLLTLFSTFAWAMDYGRSRVVVNDDETILSIYDVAAKSIYERLIVNPVTREYANEDEWTRKSTKSGRQYTCFEIQQKSEKNAVWGEASYKCVFTLAENAQGRLTGEVD